MAGAGVKSGIAYGETDDFSYKVVTDPVHIHSFNATLLHLLGINHRKFTFKHMGLEAWNIQVLVGTTGGYSANQWITLIYLENDISDIWRLDLGVEADGDQQVRIAITVRRRRSASSGADSLLAGLKKNDLAGLKKSVWRRKVLLQPLISWPLRARGRRRASASSGTTDVNFPPLPE